MRWRELITERDGAPCFVRILTFIGVLGYVALTGWAIWRGESVSYTEWAVGFTTIVAGGAGAARLKLETEGQETDDPEGNDDHSGAQRSWEK